MENIEQLKQDNVKLTERLNNAAKFFREQKAQIEALTKENEQLKNDNNVKDDSIRLNNELLETVENLKKENEELEKKLKEQQDFEANNINKVVPELEEELSKYKNTTELLNKSIDELNNTIDSKDKAYKVLQDTYNELFGENSKLKEDLENRVKQVRATENQADEELKKVITARDEWIVKYRELEEKYNEVFKASQDLGKELAEAQTKYLLELSNKDKDLQEAIESLKKANETIEKLQNQVIKLESDNNTLHKSDQEYRKAYEESKKDNEKLNKLYDDLENQKLGLECDFANLEDKYKNLKLQSDFNTENKKYLADKIFNIWTICDDIIHPIPEEQIEKIKNEENKESTIIINTETKEENIEKPSNKEEQPKHQFMSDALINI